MCVGGRHVKAFDVLFLHKHFVVVAFIINLKTNKKETKIYFHERKELMVGLVLIVQSHLIKFNFY